MAVFIADLHLSTQKEDKKSVLFVQFITNYQKNYADQPLFILGDLFNTWLGDDVSLQPYYYIIKALFDLSKSNKIFLIVGNRDFLLGNSFEQQSGVKILAEPYLFSTKTQNYVLLHGDELCIEDKKYQRFKKLIRSNTFKKYFLKLKPKQRQKIAELMRKISQRSQQKKSIQIMDVTQKAVDILMQKYPKHHLIHGHTHRQNTHQEPSYTRFVLGDWTNTKGNALCINDSGFRWIVIA